MNLQPGTCPMTTRQLIDEYFVENRTKILDLAAFLDRLDRSIDGAGEPDFRMRAFREAVELLGRPSESRVKQIQMIFSDPSTELLETLDQKSAHGAYNTNADRRGREERR